MPCKSCGSQNLGKFAGEITIHVPGFKDIHEPPVYLSPQLAVCLACGVVQFAVPEVELHLLAKAYLAAGTVSDHRKRLTPVSSVKLERKRA